jgi:hypothetical protein
MKAFIYLLHRYLGLLLAPMVLLWSFSGLVLMYVPFPELPEQKRVVLLPTLQLANCCDSAFYDNIIPADVKGVALETLNNEAVIKVTDSNNVLRIYSLNSPSLFPEIDQALARSITQTVSDLRIKQIDLIEMDQWTIYSTYHKHRPLYRVSFSDDEATELYVSSTTGEVVQLTTRFQRNWSWVGTVAHWLYPQFLQQHPKFWYGLFVGLAMFSLLLVLTGVWIGLKQLKNFSSPYKGINLIHHWGGVVVSAVLCAFLFSGILLMNPGGFIKYERVNTYDAFGRTLERLDVVNSLITLGQKAEMFSENSIVNITMSPWNNKPYWFVTSHNGEVTHYDEHFVTAKIEQAQLEKIGVKLGGDDAAEEKSSIKQYLMIAEDSYYYSHKRKVELPVWKIERDSGDSEQVFYVSPTTGKLLKTVDSSTRINRWLFSALHHWDFSHTLRQRPLWDFVLVAIMLILILFSLTGLYLSVYRLKRMVKR